jgi:hypothetical protein
MLKTIDKLFKSEGDTAKSGADKVFTSSEKTSADKDAHKKAKTAGAQLAGTSIQKLVSSCFSIYTKSSNLASKVMRKAGSAGGGKSDDDKKDKKKESED